MPNFSLDEAAVAQAEELLQQTGERVKEQAQRASDEIMGVSGAGWSGAANAAANNKQANEFAPAMAKIHAEISRLSEVLGLGRVATVSEDANSEQTFQAITPGNFTRL